MRIHAGHNNKHVIEKLITITHSYLLLLLPLIAIPFIPFGFETPKVLVFEFVVIALFFYQVVSNKLRISKELWVGVSGISLLSLVSIFFFSSDTVLFNNPIRLQGLFLQVVLLLWLLISYSQQFKISQIAALLVFLLVSLSGIFLHYPGNERAVGTLGEPNSYAGTVVLLGIFVIFSWKHTKYFPLIGSIVLILSIGAVIIAASRSALLALILTLGIFFLQRKNIPIKKIAVISTLFILLTMSLPFFSRTNSWEDRSMIWQTAIVSGFESPIFGHGFGNITQALKNTSLDLQNHIRFQFVDSSHNVFLDWWVQGGLIGIVTFFYFVYSSIKTFIKKNMLQEFDLLFCSLLIMIFNPVSIAILAIFWWCIGRGFRV